MDRIKPDWTSLPQDLLFSIAECLHTRIDIIRFRGVCRSFRSTIPLKLFPFPHSFSTATGFLRGPNASNLYPFVLRESTIYAIQPLNGISNTHDETSPPWLVKVEESKPGIVQLKNPLSSLGLFQENAMKLPKSLNLLDYRVMEVSKSYIAFPMGKVVFSSSLDETDDGFAVMAKQFYRCQNLIMWRNADKKWSKIDMSDSLDDIADIIYHNNKFYALLSTGRTVTVDSESLLLSQVAAGLGRHLQFSFLCLVESFKDLFFLVQKNFNVKVFKLDEERREWVEVVSRLELEDRVFFIGEGGSFSVSVKDFPKCKGNCVYFWGPCFEEHFYARYYVWVFHLEDGTVKKLSESPGYFYVSWTPPTWLKQH